ncbi:MAG: barstar family protein [Candidatus Doudnabacteria bacterium]|nr:barstar family protein [Candidatus Doudnabacteria bacterium]
MDKKKYVIDGNNFDTLEGFYDEVSNVLIPGASWGRNFDAFNDILYGGFGTPDEGFILIWKNVKRSKSDLGDTATLKWLEGKLHNIHPSNIPIWKQRIAMHKLRYGETLFMILVDIILNHEDIELRFQ